MRSKTLLLVGILIASLFVTVPLSPHTRITTDLKWSEDVRPVLRKHCMGCHNPAGMAPSYVDLTTYGNDRAPGARAWATAIEEEILTGRMPPWQADPRFDHFANSRRMTQDEIDIVVGWVQGGAPQGPRRNLPPPPGFDGESWQLGEPDVVLEMPEPFLLVEGVDEDRTRFRLTPELENDTWITGFEFRPQNPGTVYRMSAWIQDPPDAEAESLEVEIQVPYDPFRDEDEPEPSRMRPMRPGPHFLGQWLRGDAPVLFPDEMGRRLRKGSSIEIEVAYRRSDREGSDAEISDLSRLGLFLSREVDEVDLILEHASIGGAELALKGKKASHPVTASTTLAEDSRLVGLAPNVGDRLRHLEVRAVYPDQRSELLLWLPDYDPEWPASFQFAEPIETPAGTRVEMTGAFDVGRPKQPVRQAFDLQLVYSVNDHLVLPEPVESAPRPQQSRGGMLLGQNVAPGGEGADLGGTSAGGAAFDPRAAAHMDHSPLHGGQFFMAANQYHHIEGALPAPGNFQLYVYDDFKKPVDPRNFDGRVVFESFDDDRQEWVESEYPLEHGEPGVDFMYAQLPPDRPAPEEPIEFFASVWLAGEEVRYDFYFDELSKPPDAVELAKYAALGAHSHERPPLDIPESAEDVVSGITARRDVLTALIEEQEWLALHIPALEARDLAEALIDKLSGLGARDAGLVRQAAGRVMQSAWDLDRAGDLEDAGRAARVFDRFNEAVRAIDGIVSP